MRSRKGWRSWEARKLGYLDGRDEEDLKVGQDECDEKRVVIKSFYSWQIVDDVREWRRASKKQNSMDEQLLTVVLVASYIFDVSSHIFAICEIAISIESVTQSLVM
jgi:hypothetical protein